MIKYYTGIGSRETPPALKPMFEYIARFLIEEGYTLRSGGAEGADTFFESVVPKDKKEIYLPWYLFNHNLSPLCLVSEEAIRFSLEYHPAPERLGVGAQKMMGRNAYQVLGLDLKTKSDFVVCWREKPSGTDQAIRIAQAHGIKVFNLWGKWDRDFRKWYSDNNFDIM